MMEGIACVFTALFGIGWIITAVSIGAPIMFPLFGIGFVLLSVIKAIFSFKNAFSQNRMSDFDIVDGSEEQDPFNQRFGSPSSRIKSNYCPRCGNRVEDGYTFCNYCGNELPRR